MGLLRKTPKQMLVIDISRGSIRMAACETAGEAVRFRTITAIPLPHDSGGDGRANDATIVQLLRREVERNGWYDMRAVCLLSRSATSTQSFVLPAMPAAEMRQAIELKLHETLHFEVEQASFDFRTIREYSDDGRPRVLTLVAAAHEGTVRRAIEVLQQAGLEPVAVSAAAESLANLAYHARLCPEGQSTVHVDIGEDSTILNLFDGRLLRFSREVDTASRTFTAALMRPILTATGSIQLSHAQAEELRLAAGCPLDDDDEALPHQVRSSEILPLIDPVVQRLVSEIERSVGYLSDLMNGCRVNQIVLSGPASRMRNLSALIEQALGIPVKVMDPVARAAAHWRLSIRDGGDTDTAGFSAILGYSIGDQQPINLISSDDRLGLRLQSVARARRRVAPFAVAASLCLALAGLPIQRTYQAAGESLQSALVELAEHRGIAQELDQHVNQSLATAETVAAARGPVPDWVGLMKEFSAAVPDELQVTSLHGRHRDGKILLEVASRILSSEVPFELTVTDLTLALVESPFFEDVHIVAASADADGSGGHLVVTLAVAAGTPPLPEGSA